MKRRILVAVLLWATSVASEGQVAGRVELTARVPYAATEADLARLRNAPRVELQRLQQEQAAACRSKVNPTDCDKKTHQLNAARPLLESKINAMAKHEAEARQGLIVMRARPPAPAGSNSCVSCHAGASAMPAQDPIAPVAQPSPGPEGRKGGASATGCFIATAAFGTDDAEEVLVLKRFRDRRLSGTSGGDWFIRTYYRVSPPIADVIADRPALRAGVRTMLHPVVFAIRSPTLFVALLALSVGALVAGWSWRRRAFG